MGLKASSRERPGFVKEWAGVALPFGYLWCAGQAVSRADYAALFKEVGTNYGAGDGVNTFNVPDYRGRVGRGRDDMGGTAANRVTTAGSGMDGKTLGAAGGSEAVTLATEQIPAHDHPGVVNAILNSGSNYLGAGTPFSPRTGNSSMKGGGGAHSNISPGIIVNKIIKY